MPHVRVGCSGWHYRDWRGRVYPPDLPSSAWLQHYAQRFDCVEVNNSFYRLPEASTFEQWRTQVPARFTFAVKASRYLTHILRLRDPVDPLGRLLTRTAPLGATLGPILYQLPPRWMPERERLATFLRALPRTIAIGRRRRRLRHVIEFRDPRGYEPDVLRLLARHRVSVCVHDMEGSGSPRLVTGSLAYLRLHGFRARYGGSYPKAVLRDWAAWLRDIPARTPAFVFFNNDIHGHAVRNAETLRSLL
jgi:uncharacterized protein YecE (DUF72 family)